MIDGVLELELPCPATEGGGFFPRDEDALEELKKGAIVNELVKRFPLVGWLVGRKTLFQLLELVPG